MQKHRDPQFHRLSYYSPNPQRRPMRRQVPKPSRNYFSLRAIAGVAILIFIVGFGLHHAGASSSSHASPTEAKQAPPPEPVKPTISQSQMAEKINQVIATNPDLDVSVSVGDPRSGELTHYGTDAIYEAASVGKVLTAVFFLHEMEKGRFTLDQPVNGSTGRYNLQIMIEQSDNTAWKSLNDLINRDLMQAYAKSIGFTKYDPKTNTFTSDDIARLLLQLQQGKLLSYDHTQLLFGYMKNASRSEYLKPALPAEAALYHKAGWLEDRIHDAAIIDDQHHPYILVIFTNGHAKAHPVARETVLQQIAKTTVARFISNEYL